MGVIDPRDPVETGKSGKITFPSTAVRTIIVKPGEYAVGPEIVGLRTKPQGAIDRFDPTEGVKVVKEASELSIHAAVEPITPVSPSATATGASTIDVDATINIAGNDGILIERSTTSGSGFSQVADIDETALPWEDTGLSANTEYFYRLRGYLWDAEQKFSTYTAEVSATTGAGGAAPNAVSPAPTIAEISRTSTTMTLEATWTDVADETSYEWWAEANDGSWTDGSSGSPNTLAADATSVQYTATRQNADHDTFFCIRPCNASGCAQQTCNTFSVAGNLTAPSGLTATNPSGSQVDLDWTDMSGASVADVTAIERRLVGGSFSEIDTVAFGTTHYDDDGLADGDYEYRVRHRDTGTGSTSPYSATDSVGINSGGGGSSYPNEPAGYTEITSRGFDTKEEDGWGNVGSGNYNVPVADASAPHSPPNVGEMRFPAGFTGGVATGNAYSGTRAGAGTEAYFYFSVLFSSGWQGHDSGVNKIFFLQSSSGSSYGFGVPTAYGIDSDPLHFQFRLAGTGLRTSGGQVNLSGNLNFSASEIVRGEWNEIEMIVRMNTLDNFDGELHVWIDGVKTHGYTNVRFSDDPTASHPVDGIKWNPTWGGTGDEVVTTQWQHIDHIYMSGK